MKKLPRIILSLCSLALAITGVVFGVVAATTQSLQITSQFHFTSTSVVAKVDLEIQNAVNNATPPVAIVYNETLYNTNLDGLSNTFTKSLPQGTVLYFNMADYNDIILHYTILNMSEANILTVAGTVTATGTDASMISRKFSSSETDTLPTTNVARKVGAVNGSLTVDVILSAEIATKNVTDFQIIVSFTFGVTA